MAANAAFNGLGRPIPATVTSTLRVIVLYLPLAYVASLAFGMAGIFAALALSNLAIGGLAYVWYQRTCHYGRQAKA